MGETAIVSGWPEPSSVNHGKWRAVGMVQMPGLRVRNETAIFTSAGAAAVGCRFL